MKKQQLSEKQKEQEKIDKLKQLIRELRDKIAALESTV